MARINLLPWREERRQERKKQLLTATAMAAAFTVLIILITHLLYQDWIAYQDTRNGYLADQISLIDKTIKEIRDLEKEKRRLLDRMRAIETLQTSRPIIVHILDELVTTLPEGVFLSDIAQSNKEITIKGVAESNARVSSFMRNVEASTWLKNPRLDIVETKSQDGRRTSNFTLRVEQAGERVKDEDDQGGAS